MGEFYFVNGNLGSSYFRWLSVTFQLFSRFGKKAEEFKVNLIESLDDPEVELLTQDCLSYIYLMSNDDLPNVTRLITR